jgi:hypothetical protein
MPLSITDPRWKHLDSSYGDSGDVVTWLKEAYAQGLTEERLGDLINEVQHQGDTSTAMYAVAPHLIQLAKEHPPKLKLHLLIAAGLIYADSTSERAVACPSFLLEEFQEASDVGANALAPLLATTINCPEFIMAAAALAGFKNHHSLGRLLSSLDFYEGRYYHPALDGPFPN